MSGIRTYVQTDLRVPPTESNHVVRLSDMQEYVAGLTKDHVRVVMDTPFAGTYDATALTLTQTTPAVLVVDGVTLARNDRILLIEQLDATQNGIYVVTTLSDGTTAAVLTRAADFNTSADIVSGTIVPVTAGTVNANTRWKLTPAAIPAVLDSTALNFEKDVVDLTKVVEMTFDIEGDDTTTVFPFNHNLDTRNVTHEIRDAATGETVIAGFMRTSTNAVSVTFGVAPETGEDFVLIIRAEVDPV